MGGQQWRIGHNNNAPHDGMDATLIGVSAWRQARNCVGAAWLDGPGIEGASAAFFEAAVVGHGMVRWSGVVPSDCCPGGHGNGGRHIVGRTAVHENLGRRGRGRGRPRHCAYGQAQYEGTPIHGWLKPQHRHVLIIHRDESDAKDS